MSDSPSSQYTHLTSNCSSDRRPTSFLGSNLESTEMDPDLMMSMADMGYFQNPVWSNASTTALHEYEYEFQGASYEDDEAERLLRRRSTVEEAEARDVEWESNRSVWGSVAASSAIGPEVGPQPMRMKRRWSTRLSEGFAGFGRAVKKRADSWSWRKDSVATASAAPRVVEEGLRRDGRSSSLISLLVGSGERSRDGGDELSSEDDLFNYTMCARRHTVQGGRDQSQSQSRMTRLPWAGNHPGRRRATQTAPVREEEESTERVRFHYARSAVPQQPLPVDELQRQIEEHERFKHISTQQQMAMMARKLRIAEHEGAFSEVARDRPFRRTYYRLRSEGSIQSQASMGLKVKLAKKQKKLDAQFQRWREGEGDASPISKVFRRVWRRRSGGGEREEMVVAEGWSPLMRSDGESNDASASESGPSGSNSDERREDNAEAARYAGGAMQQAPRPF